MKSMVLLPFLLLSAYGQSTNGTNSSPSYGITTTTAGSIENYRAANGSDRMRWFLNSTVGPARLLLVGPINAGWGTLRDVPSEYGTHWDGFGKRNGMRLTGVATGNLIEAGLGSVWGEDPRYIRSHEQGFKPRLLYVMKTTFLAPRRDG